MSRAPNEAAVSSLSEQDSQEYSEDAYTDELIERILENYTFTYEPEYRLKLKHTLPKLALCACYSKPWHSQPKWRFTMKPTGSANKYVRSLLVIPESGQAALFSRKININVFRLQFVLGFNWKTTTPSLDYKLTTKWGDGPQLKRKECVRVSDSFHIRAKWNLQAHFPDMEG
eukprot:GHUV01009831.1.p1 GENE.GHUV01009831.1~~GHUV01009831.1.p1  ORF type:complete len:172 (+),score=23.75 GHUV01009831.1:306-821(+)